MVDHGCRDDDDEPHKLSTDTEDQASLNLIMHALTVACHSKLHLGHFTSCSTLCTFLMAKANEVPWQTQLYQRLDTIRSQADEEAVWFSI